MNGKREEAVIHGVSYDDERGCTVFIDCRGPTGSWGQSFGGVHLGDEERRRIFIADVCAAFGVADPELLTGKKCFILRCFSGLNERIEGLESADTGRCFVLTDWCAKHWPQNVKDRLTQRLEELAGKVRYADRVKAEALKEIETVGLDYTKWSAT